MKKIIVNGEDCTAHYVIFRFLNQKQIEPSYILANAIIEELRKVGYSINANVGKLAKKKTPPQQLK